MKLSKETLSILKNFSAINGNLLITPGNKLKTLAASKGQYATATITEEFETEFGIYDLNDFIGALSIYDDPDVTFEETGKYMVIEQTGAFKFYSADPSVLTYPAKDLVMPTPFVEFDLKESDLAIIQKTAGIIGASGIVFEGDGENLTVIVTNKANVSSNSFSKTIGKTDKKFSAHIKQENLKILVDDYTVAISDKKIAQLVSERVEYFAAVESFDTN